MFTDARKRIADSRRRRQDHQAMIYGLLETYAERREVLAEDRRVADRRVATSDRRECRLLIDVADELMAAAEDRRVGGRRLTDSPIELSAVVGH